VVDGDGEHPLLACQHRSYRQLRVGQWHAHNEHVALVATEPVERVASEDLPIRVSTTGPGLPIAPVCTSACRRNAGWRLRPR
jgi:hypothetical protein